jgi:hypothetical protein
MDTTTKPTVSQYPKMIASPILPAFSAGWAPRLDDPSGQLPDLFQFGTV